jgi:hypothetical protein
MRHVTIYTTDKEYNHFIELTKNLRYVKKVETDEEPSKAQILKEIKEAVQELKLVEQGKLKARPAKALLNEL